ncbi:MAG TPA: TPM domain-containing protein [Bacteroidia bacterium]
MNEAERQMVQAAIKEAELKTSGEIRVHVESTCNSNVIERAVSVFKEINMHLTAERNGVLIYLSIKDQKLAIIGDKGINDVVPDGFWDEIKDSMVANFKNKQFQKGLVEGIHKIGEKLMEYFPFKGDDKNELSNDISFGN